MDGIATADLMAETVGTARRDLGSDPEGTAMVLTSKVPGPFGAGAVDWAPRAARDVAAAGNHGTGTVQLWGYLLPPSDGEV